MYFSNNPTLSPLNKAYLRKHKPGDVIINSSIFVSHCPFIKKKKRLRHPGAPLTEHLNLLFSQQVFLHTARVSNSSRDAAWEGKDN